MSVGVTPTEAMRSGRSHSRMPNSEPNSDTLPTPLMRLRPSTTLIVA